MAIVYADNNTFDQAISTGITIVDFYADWCGPCQMIAPELEKLDKMVVEGQNIVKLNVDDANEIASRYGVMSIPTIIKFRDGKQVDKRVGISTAEELLTWMEK